MPDRIIGCCNIVQQRTPAVKARAFHSETELHKDTHLIKLAGCELWVVSHVNAFISELPSDFIHPIKAPNNKHLQIQLWRHTHEELHVELVVRGDEWRSSGSSRDHVHHGSLDLEKISSVEEAPHILDDLTSSLERLPCCRVDDQVQITLPVSCLLALEA